MKSQENNKKFWVKYAYVIRGKQRILAIKVLDKPMIVIELRKKINSTISNSRNQLSLREVSRQLKNFSEQGIAECLNPQEPLGRIYRLTKLGRKIREEILEISENIDKNE